MAVMKKFEGSFDRFGSAMLLLLSLVVGAAMVVA